MTRHYTLHHVDDANLCRALRAEGLSYKLIGEKMEIAPSTVWNICNVSTDQGRPGSSDPVYRKPYVVRTLEVAMECRRLRAEGMTYRAIGQHLGISAGAVWKICNVSNDANRKKSPPVG